MRVFIGCRCWNLENATSSIRLAVRFTVGIDEHHIEGCVRILSHSRGFASAAAGGFAARHGVSPQALARSPHPLVRNPQS
jgi:hypothetical protein